ncbi:MAG TPA: heme peroxidase family protein [Pyrinomonadaceae bacterium]
MARRLGHGETITTDQFQTAREDIASSIANIPLAFAATQTVDLKDFDFMFPKLQNNPNNLLPESSTTPADLARLGKTMVDSVGNDAAGDSTVPAILTYFGQFLDHDITLEMTSANLPTLTSPSLTPMPLDEIRNNIRNLRTASLDLDSLYDAPAPRDGNKMRLGVVTSLNGTQPPLKRPKGKDDFNDLPRDPRSTVPEADRAAQIGDPRNDENTIVAQLHLAFLRAHNAIVDQVGSFTDARRLLRQHYQHIVINDFLMQVADKKIVRDVLKKGGQFYDGLAEPFFMPLEFAVAAYRFGHTMVRLDYDFNLNFNTSGKAGTFPATVDLLFSFTALQGQFDPGGGTSPESGTDTLPDNWIIEWERFVGAGNTNPARLFDTKLVNPLFSLKTATGAVEQGLGAMLAVRNLLRGYRLRMPTGQAVAKAMKITPLTPAQLEAVASTVTPPSGGESQLDVLRSSGFSKRTPLWYYVLAEAAHHTGGKSLGPVGSTIIAEVLIGLIRRSDDSILRTKNWKPTLPSAKNNDFTLADLLRLAKVL